MAALAFPQDPHSVTHGAEPSYRDRVASPIGMKFLDPEVNIRLRDRCFRASRMVMPEAAIDEYRPSARAIGEVRTARKPSYILAVVLAQSAQGDGYQRFDIRALLPDIGHADGRDTVRLQALILPRRRTPRHSLSPGLPCDGDDPEADPENHLQIEETRAPSFRGNHVSLSPTEAYHRIVETM